MSAILRSVPNSESRGTGCLEAGDVLLTPEVERVAGSSLIFFPRELLLIRCLNVVPKTPLLKSPSTSSSSAPFYCSTFIVGDTHLSYASSQSTSLRS